jgi:hypothetical protein
MERDKNFLARAFDALVAGRERTARRYIERFERDYGKPADKFTKR